MDNQALSLYEQRNNRIQAAVSLVEGDRVPFIPITNNFNALRYGVTIEDAMRDNRTLIPAFEKYLDDYDPDLCYSPFFFPSIPMETAGYKNCKWPGKYYNLPPNTPYQYIDETFLEDDEYDIFLKDPSAFLIKRVLTGKYLNFSGLKYLDIQNLCGQAIFSLATLGLPDVQKTLEAMLKTGREVGESLERLTELLMVAIERGYPMLGSSCPFSPFDDFADNVRGLIPACMDLVTDPEKINEAVTRWADVTIPNAVAQAKMLHQQYSFIPLHCGMDNFMSVENYQKYYWPHLKRLMVALIDADITPVVLCEGKYNTRLETLTDVPTGKVIYIFEDVDFANAKKILSGHACIGGGMKSQLMMEGGNEKRVTEEVKRLMDICAPGGGYVMSNSLALDWEEHNLMKAWHDATLRFGKY